MKKAFFLTVITFCAVVLGGCWAAADDANTQTANTEVAAGNQLPGGEVVGNTVANVDANSISNVSGNGNGNFSPFPEVQTNKVGIHVRSGEPGEDIPEMKRAEGNPIQRTAPENSVVTNQMNKEGNPVQTRRFLKHPTIDRVEVVVLGETEKKQTIFLKDGRSLPLDAETIKNPMVASTFDMLKSIGIETKIPESPGKEQIKPKLPYGRN